MDNSKSAPMWHDPADQTAKRESDLRRVIQSAQSRIARSPTLLPRRKHRSEPARSQATASVDAELGDAPPESLNPNEVLRALEDQLAAVLQALDQESRTQRSGGPEAESLSGVAEEAAGGPHPWPQALHNAVATVEPRPAPAEALTAETDRQPRGRLRRLAAPLLSLAALLVSGAIAYSYMETTLEAPAQPDAGTQATKDTARMAAPDTAAPTAAPAPLDIRRTAARPAEMAGADGAATQPSMDAAALQPIRVAQAPTAPQGSDTAGRAQPSTERASTDRASPESDGAARAAPSPRGERAVAEAPSSDARAQPQPAEAPAAARPDAAAAGAANDTQAMRAAAEAAEAALSRPLAGALTPAWETTASQETTTAQEATTTEEATPAQETAQARTTTHVNMRASPTNNSAVLQVVPAGGEVELVSCRYWCEVVYDGQQGWIYNRFLDQDGARPTGG